MTGVARPCSHTPCRRTTIDSSGRCHDHRSAGTSATALSIPPPPVPGWMPGTGVPHPVGGYDDVVEVYDETDEGEHSYTGYFRRSRLHRLDGPARITDDAEEWYRNGVLHRGRGPAITRTDGSEEWWSRGARHHARGLAVLSASGEEEWWLRGLRHRGEDEPAIVSGERKEWWVHGKRHRVSGAAIGTSEVFEYYVDGLRSRLGGPAVVSRVDSHREWWLEGKRHREDGPAIERRTGAREWWVADRLHRTDGPAIMRGGGSNSYYLHGTEYSSDDYEEALSASPAT